MVTFIIGGARSGKSRFAQQLCSLQPKVTYVATAVINGDSEMRMRVERHRADRPPGWRTIEEPIRLADAVARAATEADCILVDCLTVWLSNFFWIHRSLETAVLEGLACTELEAVVSAGREKKLVLVANEVGWGIVPETSVARVFRDLQGFVNQRAAEMAEQVFLTVAGIPLCIKPQTPMFAPDRFAAELEAVHV